MAGAPTMAEARGRTERILRSYGSDSTWVDVLRVAIIRLWDLAELYERDADYLAGVRSAG